jgi:hypothetical protein
MPTRTGAEPSRHGTHVVADRHPAEARKVTKPCHNCALPNWATSRPGVTVRLRLKAEGAFHRRDRHLTVWCCGEDCAWQALAIAAMGSATHKWSITFRDFVTLNPELLERSQVRSDRDETPISDPHKQRCCEGAKPESGPTPLTRDFVPRKGGRPRIYRDTAARKRAYRARHRQKAVISSRSQETAIGSIGPKQVGTDASLPVPLPKDCDRSIQGASTSCGERET